MRRSIRRHGLIARGDRVLVALSGGSDSVGLVFVLRDLAEADGFHLAALAHVNHALRPTAGRDEQFCRALARRLALPLVVERVDTAGYAGAQRLSIEEAARRLRYACLLRAAAAHAADGVAVGHTLDDQAETFLLKLIRGAGGTGLGGIYPRRDQVVRPLLGVTRSALRQWLAHRGESWVEDETNADLGNPRNRLRHETLPGLARAFGSSAVPAIARAAEIVREDAQWLDGQAARRVEALVRPGADGLEIDRRALLAEPVAIRRRVVREALRLACPNAEIGLDHVESACDVAAGDSAGADVPGGRVELRREMVVLLTR